MVCPQWLLKQTHPPPRRRLEGFLQAGCLPAQEAGHLNTVSDFEARLTRNQGPEAGEPPSCQSLFCGSATAL